MELVIDLAFKPYLSLIDKGEIVDEKECLSEHSSDLVMKEIDELLRKNNVDINNIGGFLINVGPGSFTGLRVSIAIAKGFGFLNDKKFKIFSSFDYISSNKVKVVPAFSSYVYIDDGKKRDCVSIESLLNKKCVTFDKEIFDKLSEAKIDIELMPKLKINEIEKALNEVSIRDLEPLYLRKSQAELMREQKLKNAK